MFHNPPVLHRLFFALIPPRPLARSVAAAAGWFQRGPGGLAAERLHMTMFILDDMVEVAPGLPETLRGSALRCAPDLWRSHSKSRAGAGSPSRCDRRIAMPVLSGCTSNSPSERALAGSRSGPATASRRT